eukprot:314138_1
MMPRYGNTHSELTLHVQLQLKKPSQSLPIKTSKEEVSGNDADFICDQRTNDDDQNDDFVTIRSMFADSESNETNLGHALVPIRIVNQTQWHYIVYGIALVRNSSRGTTSETLHNKIEHAQNTTKHQRKRCMINRLNTDGIRSK